MPLSDAVVQDIRKVLAEHDIEGLISMGAPRDEYDSESRELAFQIQQWGVPAPETLYHWLRQIWAESFELAEDELRKRDNALRNAAADIRAFSER